MFRTALLLLGAALAGQQQVLRVTTRMVQVNVVVRKDGRPVAGLAREDFRLSDDGKPQEIRFFSMQATAARRDAAPPAPVNTFTNRLELRRDIPNAITAVLIDQVNTAPEDQAQVKRAVVDFLTGIDPRTRIALYSLDVKLRVVHDLSSDTESLLRALAAHRTRPAGELRESTPAVLDSGVAEVDAWLNEGEQLMSDWAIQQRVTRTLAGVEAIAHHLGKLPGRKNLVWVSGSFPLSMDPNRFMTYNALKSPRPESYGGYVERCARVLNDADMAVYPVDARGLAANSLFSAERLPLRRTAIETVIRDAASTQETMHVLASRTGGKAYTNRNDLGRAMRDALADAEVTYTLGYYPAHDIWDGSFHKVAVKVNRPRVEVRHRAGYFAFGDAVEIPQEREQAIKEAALSPLDAYTVPMDVQASAGPKGALRLLVTLEHGNYDVRLVQQTRDGGAIGPDTMRVEGSSFTGDLPLVEGATRVRVVVRNVRSGAVGSVTIPLSGVLR